jgi:hypothetical protein
LIRIAVTAAAFDTIAATMLWGSARYECKHDESGRHIWLKPRIANELRYLRGPGSGAR